MGIVDLLVFGIFIVSVVGIGIAKSRDVNDGENDAQDYFLAGRGLTWPLVGFSLIAANISTEQFVGMSGKAADWLGMAIASYEWMAAATLVVVAFVFLPTFLRSGIYTIPEFLEYRYNAFARTVMACATLIILVGVPTASVIFSGAKVITGNFQGTTFLGLQLGDITVGCWIIGVLAAVYVFAGGLKACAWADLIQGAALIIGGAILAGLAMTALDQADPEQLAQTSVSGVTAAELQEATPLQRFWKLNDAPIPDGKLHMVRDQDDKEIPWTALVLGLWIPNFFYWGLNQYITQRTLGSRSLAEGQKGIVFAALLKLVIPFIVVIPGILAYNLFSAELAQDAVVRNARLIASSSPELYKSLSAGMQPDAELQRNALVQDEIEGYLAAGGSESTKIVYGFADGFAERHIDDLAKIVAHNRSQLAGAGELPDDPGAGADVAALATHNAALIELAGDSEVTSDTLVTYDYDNAFPTLLRELLPTGSGLKGFVLAAIFGAVVSSLASMLNSASTIATMDLYRKVRPDAAQGELVGVGRFFTILFVLIAMIIAPNLGSPAFGGIFTFIQEFQGFISPGILAIFIFGLLVHRAPRSCGTIGLLLSPILFGLFKFSGAIPGLGEIGILQTIAEWSFLNRMALSFVLILATLTLVTLVSPLKEPIELPTNPDMNLESSPTAKLAGVGVIILTAILYVVFW